MAERDRRRRPRRCPSCGGNNVGRGHQVEGIMITLVPASGGAPAVTVPAFSDICRDCGMVMLFVRLGYGDEIDS